MSSTEFEDKITSGDQVLYGLLYHSGGEDHAEVSIWNITAKGLVWKETKKKSGRNSWNLLEQYGFKYK